MRPFRQLVPVCLLGLLLGSSGNLMAQPVEGGTVRILVGFAPGGAVDAVARAFAEQLRQETKATVMVENRPGATGTLAIDAMLSASANGETVALIPSSVLALTPFVMKAVRHDALRDFTTLGNLAEYGFAFAAGPASQARSVEQYKTWAQQNPESSSFASAGAGTPQHFLGVQLERLLGIGMTHVPYRGGSAAVTDVIGGQVPLLATTETFLVPHEGQGRLHTLLVTSRARNPMLPNAPTAREAGFPELEATDWYGLFASAKTSAEHVAQWRAAVGKVLERPQFSDAMRGMGNVIPAQQAADFKAVLEGERNTWRERVNQAGFTPES